MSSSGKVVGRMARMAWLFFALLAGCLNGQIPAVAAQDTPNVLFILDASGSMWGRLEKVEKIVIAKKRMTELVQDWENVNMGLIVYGHRRKGDCDDIEMLVPLGPGNQERIITQIQAINPKGKTPIQRSIALAARHLETLEEETEIVLVSDGLETCDNDPCGYVRSLKQKGITFTLDVVGFDVKDEEREQLECLANAGGGRYYSARNAMQLKEAFTEVKTEVVEKVEGKSVFGSKKEIPFSLKGNIYFLKSGTSHLPNFEHLTPVGSIYATELNIPTRSFEKGFPGVTDRFEWFAIDYSGNFWIDAPGNYHFRLASDDGSKLFINDKLLINNDGLHPTVSKEAALYLGRGLHQIRVHYYQGPRTEVALVLEVAMEGESYQPFNTQKMAPKIDEENVYVDSRGTQVRFALGDFSFADEVVAFKEGSPAARHENQPKDALGAPDYLDATDVGDVTLGCGGVLVLKFVDNVLIDVNGPDLYVFEVGPAVEPTGLAISKDGEEWIELGEISGGEASIDIAPFVKPGDEFRYVGLVDLETHCDGDYPGADIDAVGAMGSILTNNQKAAESRSGAGMWFGVFTPQPAGDAYAYNGDMRQFTEAIEHWWDEGFILSSVTYGDGRWFGIFNPQQGGNAYIIGESLAEFKEAIEKKWDEGYDLVSVAYGEGLWFGVFYQQKPRNGYSTAASTANFEDVIKERWNQGHRLNSVAYGDGLWVGIFSPQKGGNAYVYHKNLQEFTKHVKSRWEEKYDLTSVAYGEGVWFGVFQQQTPANSYSAAGSIGKFEDVIKERWKQGQHLLSVSYGN